MSDIPSLTTFEFATLRLEALKIVKGNGKTDAMKLLDAAEFIAKWAIDGKAPQEPSEMP